MSFFIEHERFREDKKAHLAHVYERLFPHSSWSTLPRFGLLGLTMNLPPIMSNSQKIGYVYKDWKQKPATGEGFTFRFNLDGSLDKIGMELILTDILLESQSIDPRKTLRFDAYMHEGERFGGIARAAIGLLKFPVWFLPEPPGRSQFHVRMIHVLGVEHNEKPAALIYFE